MRGHEATAMKIGHLNPISKGKAMKTPPFGTIYKFWTSAYRAAGDLKKRNAGVDIIVHIEKAPYGAGYVVRSIPAHVELFLLKSFLRLGIKMPGTLFTVFNSDDPGLYSRQAESLENQHVREMDLRHACHKTYKAALFAIVLASFSILCFLLYNAFYGEAQQKEYGLMIIEYLAIGLAGYGVISGIAGLFKKFLSRVGNNPRR